MSIFGLQKMESVYASRIVIKVFLGQPGYAKRAFDNFEASKRFFFDEFAPHEDQYSGQNYAFTGSVAINPD